MLTTLESVFRSLKTDLDLRPVYRQIQRRVEGHLFIGVLAYYAVHTLRQRLKAEGIDDSWETPRRTHLHVRKASRPEPAGRGRRSFERAYPSPRISARYSAKRPRS